MTEQEREQMILDNIGLVKKIAGRFARIPGTYEDLVQQGYEGLIRAVDKFDPERGFQFSTYAHFWIRSKMQNFVRDALPLKVPDKFAKQIYHIKVTRDMLLNQNMPVTPERLSEESGIELQTVNKALEYQQLEPDSIDWEPENPSEQGFMPGYYDPVSYDSYVGMELREMLDTLPAEQAQAVYYPVMGYTVTDAAKMEGVSRQTMSERRTAGMKSLTRLGDIG